VGIGRNSELGNPVKYALDAQSWAKDTSGERTGHRALSLSVRTVLCTVQVQVSHGDGKTRNLNSSESS
jgi:hypothetical protein